MTIDWSALLLVAVATITAAISIVGLFALGVAALTGQATDRGTQPVSTAARLAGYGCLTVAGMMAVYGLYLIIPQFH